MKVSCPACDSKYTIADEKVVGRKVKVRCKSCGGQILINGTIPPPPPDANDAALEGTHANAGADGISGASAHEESKSSPATASSKSGPSHATPGASDGITWSVNVAENDERSLNTDEVVAGYLSGEFAGEVYVWHDGMTDWLAIPDVPHLMAAVEATKHQGAANPSVAKLASTTDAPPASTPARAKALPTASRGTKAHDGVVTSVVPEVSGKKTAARATGAKRPQSAHDLFAASNSAGSESDVPVSDDDDDAAQKKTGARNENSVLFSLDALKAGITAAPTPSQAKPASGKKAPATPRKKLEDLMAEPAGAMTSGPMAGPLMLSTNQSLLTAPAPPPPKPKPEPVPSVAPAPMTAEALAFANEKEKTKRLIIGAVAAIVVVGAVAGIAIAMTKSKPEPIAAAKAVPSAAVAVAITEPPKPVAADPKPAESAAPAASAASASTVKVAAVGAGGPKVGAVTGPKTEPKAEPKKEPKAEPTGPVSSGVASFNTGAASQALSVAAAQTSICKKPDGPTGTGKVQVTFAPSGRATTANIVSGPFGGTAVGGCVSGVFKRAKVPAFTGDPVTVSKSFSISQ